MKIIIIGLAGLVIMNITAKVMKSVIILYSSFKHIFNVKLTDN